MIRWMSVMVITAGCEEKLVSDREFAARNSAGHFSKGEK
jgi:hypothetical protein